MSEKRAFIKQFWKEKKMVGAMAPSSRFLAQKMLANIDFNEAKVIIELGPGTGVFTDKILEKMSADTVLLVFELNEIFCNQLQKRITDKRAHIIFDSAEKIEYYLAEYNLDKADVVVSSLPLANFPQDIRDSVLKTLCKEIEFLKPNIIITLGGISFSQLTNQGITFEKNPEIKKVHFTEEVLADKKDIEILPFVHLAARFRNIELFIKRNLNKELKKGANENYGSLYYEMLKKYLE